MPFGRRAQHAGRGHRVEASSLRPRASRHPPPATPCDHPRAWAPGLAWAGLGSTQRPSYPSRVRVAKPIPSTASPSVVVGSPPDGGAGRGHARTVAVLRRRQDQYNAPPRGAMPRTPPAAVMRGCISVHCGSGWQLAGFSTLTSSKLTSRSTSQLAYPGSTARQKDASH